MAVRMRLTRVGSKKNPIYRVVVADSRSPRDGRFIEIVGRYNPQTDPSTIDLDADKVQGLARQGRAAVRAGRAADQGRRHRVDRVEELLTWIARGLVDEPDAVRVERDRRGRRRRPAASRAPRRRRQGDRQAGPGRARAPHRRALGRGPRRPPPDARDRRLSLERPMDDPDRLVPIGRVGRPHGLDGAFVVEQASDDERRWDVGARRHRRRCARARHVDRVASGGGRRAIRLDRPVPRGAELSVRLRDLPPPEPDSYYAFQLVGLDVVDDEGVAVGRVVEVDPGAGERQPGARRRYARPVDRGRDPGDRPRGAQDRGRQGLPRPARGTLDRRARRRLHAGPARLRLAHRAEAARDRARHRAGAAAPQLPRHDAASRGAGGRRSLRRRRRHGAPRRRRRRGARGRLRRRRARRGSSR